MEREDAKEQQGASQSSEKTTRTSQGRNWTKFAITQQVIELGKPRTHLKEQVLLFWFASVSVFPKSSKFSQFENLIF